MAAILGSRAETRILTLRVQGVKLEDLRKAIEPAVESVIDIRETKVS
ncbi:hypothetical protein SDC9_192664 [bioreactor metagenome]|uniref:Uncharacterized protein n=1 Tax=bioreactor metagenome TaxID=1076179 RepID=A0A645I1D0_9ZZZZ